MCPRSPFDTSGRTVPPIMVSFTRLRRRQRRPGYRTMIGMLFSGFFAVKMHSLDTLFYVRIKLNDLRCEIPPAPLFERGETSLARHFLHPPFAKGGDLFGSPFPPASPFCKGGWRGIFMRGGDQHTGHECLRRRQEMNDPAASGGEYNPKGIQGCSSDREAEAHCSGKTAQKRG